ncbi:hypothetical protein I7I53_05764 [Histoplasma capsulatum var. duboisii H88]|uniref:Uncharacterized protein n=1 Tax=Ajellomyces capsulatus (strain H88) TaxID=544711 RepID=A0A8A1LTA9_AJEC8|nr:hypothetical protein I7I53_05764 [Histoplasma capsulatum var. duboisii H88]
MKGLARLFTKEKSEDRVQWRQMKLIESGWSLASNHAKTYLFAVPICGIPIFKVLLFDHLHLIAVGFAIGKIFELQFIIALDIIGGSEVRHCVSFREMNASATEVILYCHGTILSKLSSCCGR